MKQLLVFILFISAAGLIQAQSLTPKTSYVGLSGDVSHYWLYNKKEFNAPDTAFGVKNDSVILNAYATGISFGHFFNSRFGVEASLLYSTQTQYYGHFYGSSYYWEAYTQLQYIRLPINLIRRYQISENSFLQYSSGIRLSYLTYAIDYSKAASMPGTGSVLGLYIFENDTYRHWYESEVVPGEWADIPDVHRDWRYHRVVFGLTAGLQYEYFLTNRISIFGGVKFSADISNIDNTNALSYYQEDGYLRAAPSWEEYRYGFWDVRYDRSPSHNINAGLQAGIKFWFGENTLNIKVKKRRPLDW